MDNEPPDLTFCPRRECQRCGHKRYTLCCTTCPVHTLDEDGERRYPIIKAGDQ